jgi:pantetheine-phosphate adenylyltransferase
MMRTGIYPGTFDPITLGHGDIIRRALNVVDKLIIGVALDTGKEPLFDLATRTALVKSDIAALGANAERVDVKAFEGLLATFARANGASLLVRGLRAVSDFEYEFQMASVNNKIAPDLETVFLTASDHTHFISSRFVKQIARLGGDVLPFVSPNVASALAKHFSVSE